MNSHPARRRHPIGRGSLGGTNCKTTTNAGGDSFLHSTNLMLVHERSLQEIFQGAHQIIDVVPLRFPAPMCAAAPDFWTTG